MSEESKPPSVRAFIAHCGIWLSALHQGNSRIVLPFLACTHGDSPFHPRACDLSLATSWHWHAPVSFLCQSQDSRPASFGTPVRPAGGETFLRFEPDSRSSSLGCQIGHGTYKSIVAGGWKSMAISPLRKKFFNFQVRTCYVDSSCMHA